MDRADELAGQIDRGLPSPLGPDVFAGWIDAARQGCDQAFNQLFTACGPYLLLVANQELAPEIQAKIGASDIVQDTLVHARKSFDRFRGTSREELIAWLRAVLLNNLQDATRRFLETGMRQVAREVSLERELAEAGHPVDAAAPAPEARMTRDEEAVRLEAALGRLPDDYRTVIRLRNWEEKSFHEIGQCMHRSPEAARKLWARAVDRLRALLQPGEASAGETHDG